MPGWRKPWHNREVVELLVERLIRATGPDRLLDVEIWNQVGWTHDGDFDLAWRNQLPISPHEIINGMTLGEAIVRFPTDFQGSGRSWNIPYLTASLDAAESLMGPVEQPFVWSFVRDFAGLNRVRVSDSQEIQFTKDGDTMPLAVCAAALAAILRRAEET